MYISTLLKICCFVWASRPSEAHLPPEHSKSCPPDEVRTSEQMSDVQHGHPCSNVLDDPETWKQDPDPTVIYSRRTKHFSQFGI